MEHQTVVTMQRTRWLMGIAIALLVVLSFAAGFRVGEWKQGGLLPLRIALAPGLTPPSESHRALGSQRGGGKW